MANTLEGVKSPIAFSPTGKLLTSEEATMVKEIVRDYILNGGFDWYGSPDRMWKGLNNMIQDDDVTTVAEVAETFLQVRLGNLPYITHVQVAARTDDVDVHLEILYKINRNSEPVAEDFNLTEMSNE